MRQRIAETIFLVLFLGGLLALNVVPAWVAARIRDEPLGEYWLAWLMAPLWLVLLWLAVPWFVQLSGGAAAVDEGMRKDIVRAREPMQLFWPFLMMSRWLAVKGLEGSLRAASPRRRYGHLAVMPFPALVLLTIVLMQITNSALSGPYEPVTCAVVRSWVQDGKASRVFVCHRASGEALEEGGPSAFVPNRFAARARKGGLGVWLLDRRGVQSADGG